MKGRAAPHPPRRPGDPRIFRRALPLALAGMAVGLGGCIRATWWSPDGRSLLITDLRSEGGGLALLDVPGGRVRWLISSRKGTGVFSPAWGPDGKRVCYFRGETRRGGRVHLCVLKLATGKETVAAPEIRVPKSDGWILYHSAAWSPDGARIVYQTFAGIQSRLWTVAPDGRDARPLVPEVPSAAWPAWSPDGRRIAYAAAERTRPQRWTAIETARPDGTDRRRVWEWPAGRRIERPPVWSADGRRLAVVLYGRFEGAEAWEVDVDRQAARRIAGLPSKPQEISFSADLRTVAFVRERKDDYTAELLRSGDSRARVFATMRNGRASRHSLPQLSPDGQTVALVESSSQRTVRIWLYPTRGGPGKSYALPR